MFPSAPREQIRASPAVITSHYHSPALVQEQRHTPDVLFELLCCSSLSHTHTGSFALVQNQAFKMHRFAALLVLEKGIPEGFALACQLERGQGQTVLIRL